MSNPYTSPPDWASLIFGVCFGFAVAGLIWSGLFQIGRLYGWNLAKFDKLGNVIEVMPP